MKFDTMTLVLLVVAYFVGAKFPQLARAVGL